MKLLLYLWQLPQNILGLLLVLYFKGEKHSLNGITYYYSWGISGGISLGDYIILNKHRESSIRHEWGHSIQSRALGPLYLIIIGIPSLLWAMMYGRVIKESYNGYYRFYTEKSADKLGGVKR